MATGSLRTGSNRSGSDLAGQKLLSGAFRSVVRDHAKAGQRRVDCAYKRVELDLAEDLESKCARRFGKV